MWRDQADTSLDMKPRSGIQWVTGAFRVRYIILDVVFLHFPVGERNHVSGDVGEALWYLRDSIIIRRVSVRHSSGFPDLPCHIFSLRVPFFWVMNSSVVNVATLRLVVLKVWVKKVCPKDRVRSQRWKGVLSGVESVHSQERSRKEYARMIMSQLPRFSERLSN